jgi:hypothetical protein
VINLLLFSFVIGLANPKTVSIKPAGTKDEPAVVVSLSKPKESNKPSRSLHKTVMKKNLVKMAKSVKSQVLILLLYF